MNTNYSDRQRRRLSADEKQLLADITGRLSPHLQQAVEAISAGRQISVADAAALREAVSEELSATGIDADFGAVNERGRQLDALIDKIGAVSGLYDE